MIADRSPDRRLGAGLVGADRAEAREEVPGQVAEPRRRPRRRAARPAAAPTAPRQPSIASRKRVSLARCERRGLADRLSVRAHSYTCRYFRTKRIEIRFMMQREHEQRACPRRRSSCTRCCRWAMSPFGGGADERRERVDAGRAGRALLLATWPAATSTIMVSPIARETPSTIAATIPESAAGNTTRSDTWSFEAPSPKAPSRSDCGHRRHRVLGDRRDRRHDHEAHDDAGGERVEDVDLRR